ncbi:MAG: sortase [Anaerolineae bacterium]|nr:sortase [Anaerolineae bacterium]
MKKLSNAQILIEQIALLLASFVWTVVVLAVVSMVWVYQDVQTRWEFVLNAPPEALAQAAPPPTATPTPTMTPWRGPGPTATPTATQPPTPTATLVVKPPDILPETFNADEPTPMPVAVPSLDEVAEAGAEQANSAAIAPTSLPTLIAQSPDQNPEPTPTSFPLPAEPSAESGVPTRLVIESVGIDSAVVSVGWYVVEQAGRQYSIWNVADNAVGWHKTSARLGQPGNSVMTGHHNVKGEVFRDLVNVEVGDKVVVYSGEQAYEYTVELKTIVKEKGESIDVRRQNAQWIATTNDERLTLVTCWPYTNNTHRVIVVAKPL